MINIVLIHLPALSMESWRVFKMKFFIRTRIQLSSSALELNLFCSSLILFHPPHPHRHSHPSHLTSLTNRKNWAEKCASVFKSFWGKISKGKLVQNFFHLLPELLSWEMEKVALANDLIKFKVTATRFRRSNFHFHFYSLCKLYGLSSNRKYSSLLIISRTKFSLTKKEIIFSSRSKETRVDLLDLVEAA